MRLYLSMSLLLTLLHMQAVASVMPADSVGMEKDGEKTFILHKVEAKETLYSLSRRYNVTIYQIIEHNPPTEFGLDIGQIIKVPFLPQEAVVKSEPAEGEIIHIVKPKETMFSLSQLYKVNIEDIKKWNDLENNLLEIGQQLLIKVAKEPVAVSKEPTAPIDKDIEGAKTYVVKPGETLYSISRQFGITITDIKEWNKLADSEISIGQQLIIGVHQNEPVYAGVSTVEHQEMDILTASTEKTPVAKNPAEERPMVEMAEEDVDKNSVADGSNNDPVVTDVDEVESSTRFEEVSESGIAELIEGSGSTRKYLALHRTAAIGTILRVRNEMNDQEVFVRVLGKLPDTGVNKNVLIRISKPAYERLGAIDPKFRVSISYIP